MKELMTELDMVSSFVIGILIGILMGIILRIIYIQLQNIIFYFSKGEKEIRKNLKKFREFLPDCEIWYSRDDVCYKLYYKKSQIRWCEKRPSNLKHIEDIGLYEFNDFNELKKIKIKEL